MAGRGAAMHLPQEQLAPDMLADLLQRLDRTQLLAMARQARSLALPRAAERVADELDRLVKR
jgi:UDP-N-acetylglucosamine--N-acetylmuramyl-(pentapeptide) pyrophosphoryl-undecaprenol N-acetylglucosamine transferase